MVGLPITLPIPQEAIIASYNGIDLATGRGIATFYLGDTTDDFLMNSNVFYGDAGMTEDDGGSTYLLDIDFDKKLEKPLVIEGDMIISFSAMFGVTSGSAGPHVWTWNVAFSKWDGTTETIIANKDVDFPTSSLTSGQNIIFRRTCSLAIPKTKFKIGETIRVTIKNEGDASGGWFHVLAHDPAGRSSLPSISGLPDADWSGRTGGSAAYALIPIVVDL
jgi:hypothetical protein